MMKKVRILIADDHEIVRQGIRNVLATQPDCEVVGEAGTGREAVQEALRLKPDIAIIDISMPEMNGLEATRQIVASVPRTQVMILTLHENDQLVRDVLAAGARGYVLKSDASRDLILAVQALAEQKPFFTAKVTEMMLDRYRTGIPDESCSPAERLTPRETEILQLVAEGRTNKEVAAILALSVKTVETHRSNIMEKLNLHTVSDLIRYAIRNRIIDVT